MNFFDSSILYFLNQFSQKFIVLDRVVVFLEHYPLFKGAIFLAFLWSWWLQVSSDLVQRRKIILSTLVGCFLAIFLARLLALGLPFRARPLNNEAIQFLLPSGVPQETLSSWSSFPSDHAALFFGLTTGFFLLNKKLGIMALIYSCIVVMLPRMYLGFHYPTDILGGGIIGALSVGMITRTPFRERIAHFGLGWLERFPVAFYVCFFLVTYQFVVLFDDVRGVARLLIDIIHYYQHGKIWPEN